MKHRFFFSLTGLLLLLSLCACGQTETVEMTETTETTVEISEPAVASEEVAAAEESAEPEASDEAEAPEAAETGAEDEDDPCASLSDDKYQVVDGVLYKDGEAVPADATDVTIWKLDTDDYSFLAQFTQLDYLELRCCDITDLSVLEQLPSLQYLSLRNCSGVTDLSPLAQLPKLRNLYIFCCDGVSDLSPLAEVTGLEHLILNDCPAVTDLSALAGLQKLWDLNLEGCTGISDLTPLAACTALEQLTLSVPIDTIPALGDLPALESLWLRGEMVTDLTPLAALPNLRKLELRGTAVTDLSPLAEVTSLREITLSDTPVSDLSALTALPVLKYLLMEGTAVTDFAPLGQMAALQELCIYEPAFTDLTVLDGLQWLEILTLLSGDSGVTDYAVLAEMALPRLHRLTCSLDEDAEENAALLDILQQTYPYCQINDAEPLAEAVYACVDGVLYYGGQPVNTGLTELDLGQATGLDDLSFLDQFTRLEDLYLSGSAIADLSPILECTTLKALFLSDLDAVTELPDLSRLPDLEMLTLWDVPLSDFSVLSELTGLTRLEIHCKEFSDLSVLTGLTRLERLDFMYTSVTDFTPLLEADLPDLVSILCSADEASLAALRAAYPSADIP